MGKALTRIGLALWTRLWSGKERKIQEICDGSASRQQAEVPLPIAVAPQGDHPNITRRLVTDRN
jgi:hypothetical protein